MVLALPPDEAEPGMVLARTVLGNAGQVLLAAGTRLTNDYLRSLRRMGVQRLYIQEEGEPAGGDPDVLSEQTRRTAAAELRKLAHQVQDSLAAKGMTGPGPRGLKLDGVKTAVSRIVDDVLANRWAVYNLTDLGAHDHYSLRHSIGVCLLSVLIGIRMQYNMDQLRELALAAILHDIGKVAVPDGVLNKPGPLTPDEMEIMRAHTTTGWEILRRQHDLSLFVAHTAWQHHERFCGGGYPRGLKGAEILHYARIVAVADAFEAMTSDRPYRRAMPRKVALAKITGEMASWYDPVLLPHLVHCVLAPGEGDDAR